MSGIGPILGYTANFNFALINYDYPRWHTYQNQNWSALDAIISTIFAGGAKGVWQNGEQYNISDRVIDDTSSMIYLCVVPHTTPLTGTFANERATNPTYWYRITYLPVSRGTWAPSTLYTSGSFLTYNNQYAVVNYDFVSGTSFANDLAAGRLSIIIDLTGYNPTLSLSKASNLSDLADAPTARNNLGLGSAALQTTGTFLQTANALSDVNAVTARANLGLGTAATTSASSYLGKNNNLNDITNAASARGNLGLGSLAVLNTVDPSQINGIGATGQNLLLTQNSAAATTFINPFVGDNGSGGTKGLVPAPASGDAASGKYLGAGGSWSVPANKAPITIAAATTLTTGNINTNVQVSASATANVVLNLPMAPPFGWSTGRLTSYSRRAVMVVTPASGDFVDGVLNGTINISYRQTVEFFYDTDGWHTEWRDRSPIIDVLNLNNTSTYDLIIPAGYQQLEIELSNVVPSNNAVDLGYRLSSDYGTTVKSGSADYTAQYTGLTTTTSYAGIISSMSNAFGSARAMLTRGFIDTKYGTYLGFYAGVNSQPAQSNVLVQSYQATGPISPNWLRLLVLTGTFSCNGFVRAIPYT